MKTRKEKKKKKTIEALNVEPEKIQLNIATFIWRFCSLN